MKTHTRLALIFLLFFAAHGLAARAPSAPAAEEWTGSPEQKIFGLTTIWAEAKYAFPSFEQVPDLDWDQAFQDFIPRVAEAEDLESYYMLLMEFAGLLNDGHTSVLPPWGYFRPDFDSPPLEVQVVEGGFVVARTGTTAELKDQDVTPGLEILAIDGVPTRPYFDDKVNRYYPRGSRHTSDAMNVVYLLRGPANSKVALTVSDPTGEQRDVTLTRRSVLEDGRPFLPRLLLWLMANPALETRDLDGGVKYVRIANFQNPGLVDGFLDLIDGLAGDGTRALLIDLRFCLGGRSDLADKMMGSLIDEPVSSPLRKYPHYVAARRNWGRSPEWSTEKSTIPPRDGSRFRGPVVILTSGITSSTSEDFAISLRHAGRAVMVGERTGGAAGNPLSRDLPGGGKFMMATFRAYLPDGGEYVGVGVKPDVEAAPTKASIAQGDDVVLTKGLEVLENWESYAR
jgi:C-terminal processing protease CtpA/Prc